MTQTLERSPFTKQPLRRDVLSPSRLGETAYSMHSIRLRGPWELYLPGSGEPQRVEMPATWQTLLALTSHAPLPSPARLLRRFGLPTGITPTDRLRLVIESSSAPCQIELNGQPLGSIASSQQASSFDVTGLLAARNELAIILDLQRESDRATPSAPLSDVRLEIIPPSGGQK